MDSTEPILTLYASAQAVGPMEERLVLDACRHVLDTWGRAPLPTSLVWFSDRSAWRDFCLEAFGDGAQRAWQRGAARAGIIALWAGEEPRTDLLATLLHEYAHSVSEAYFGDGYFSHVPQWLNEGIADVFARPAMVVAFSLSGDMVRAAWRGGLRPTLEDLSTDLYSGDVPGRYAIARLMAAEMVGASGIGLVPRFLRDAGRESGVEPAMVRLFGLTGHEAYRRVLERLGIRSP